jgi:hypothetical protein
VTSISDPDVLAIANHNGAVLLIVDQEFGELFYRKQLSTRLDTCTAGTRGSQHESDSPKIISFA